MNKFSIQIQLIFLLSLANFCFTLPQIDPLLLEKLTNYRQGQNNGLNIFVTMKSGTGDILEQISSSSIDLNHSDRAFQLQASLKAHAELTQQPILNLIQTSSHFSLVEGQSVKSFWISNQIYIKNANFELIQELSEREDIGKIEEEKLIHLDIPLDVQSASEGNVRGKNVDVDWNLALIQAPKVWSQGIDGKGVLVGNIDTGVRSTHEALVSNYKNDAYSWFDPYEFSEKAYDDNGHGTHTMGTIVGTMNGVGVSPGSKWMTCKAFRSSGSALQSALLSCGQFILCPTLPNGKNPDCKQAPRVINNSWNSRDQTAGWFVDVINAWHVANIIPIFSNGNFGPDCGTLGSQVIHKVIAVGATTEEDKLAYFSSVGPTQSNEVKPDISSPGHFIKSAYNNSDSSYVLSSGTSMAAPHVAGVIALLLSKSPTLNYDEVKTILESTAEKNLTFAGVSCGGIPDSKFPNNHFGHGRLNAFGAYDCVLKNNICIESSGNATGINWLMLQLLLIFSSIYYCTI